MYMLLVKIFGLEHMLRRPDEDDQGAVPEKINLSTWIRLVALGAFAISLLFYVFWYLPVLGGKWAEITIISKEKGPDFICSELSSRSCYWVTTDKGTFQVIRRHLGRGVTLEEFDSLEVGRGYLVRVLSDDIYEIRDP